KEILDQVGKRKTLTVEAEIEISWLRSLYWAKRADYRKAQDFLATVVSSEPWNVSYLVQEVMMRMRNATTETTLNIDPILFKLAALDEKDLDWQTFEQMTDQLEALHL